MTNEKLTVEEKTMKKQEADIQKKDSLILQLDQQLISLRREQQKEQKKNLKTISNQTKHIKELQQMQNTTTNLSIEAPYVHVKIMKILGGKGKKGEISVSAGGSIEKINDDDVRNFSESMLRILNEKIDYALQELQKEETSE